MTTRLRCGARRGKSDHISNRLAAIRANRAPDVGAVAAHLLGQAWFREVVVMALFLRSCREM